MYTVKWNIFNFNVLLYFIISVYAMISWANIMKWSFLCLKIVELLPRERPNVKHAIVGYLRLPQPTPAPALMRELH